MENPQHPESCIVFYYFVTGLAQWRIESNTVRRFKSTVSPVIKYKRAHTWGIGVTGSRVWFRPICLVRAGSNPVSPTMLSGLCNFNRMNPVIKALGAGERTGALCKGKSSNCSLKAQKSGRGRFIGSCA